MIRHVDLEIRINRFRTLKNMYWTVGVVGINNRKSKSNECLSLIKIFQFSWYILISFPLVIGPFQIVTGKVGLWLAVEIGKPVLSCSFSPRWHDRETGPCRSVHGKSLEYLCHKWRHLNDYCIIFTSYEMLPRALQCSCFYLSRSAYLNTSLITSFSNSCDCIRSNSRFFVRKVFYLRNLYNEVNRVILEGNL
jgi:hypothetical protein